MTTPLAPLLTDALAAVRRRLDEARGDRSYWEGRLATSALATATAVSAFSVAAQAEGVRTPDRVGGPDTLTEDSLHTSILGGLTWLARHRNGDGGWGDTTRSRSNIAATFLGLAAIRLAGRVVDLPAEAAEAASGAKQWIDRAGGVSAVRERYGTDRTFAVPILVNAALAGLADWRDVTPLPFELAVLPRGLFRFLGLRVVSYALPALIAVGLAAHVHAPSRHPLARLCRRLTTRAALRRLVGLIPESGGFLEAAPLTAFVAMSLCAAGRGDHPAAQRGLAFLAATQRDDGGWPIDTNLSVWNTTLAVNALGAGSAETRDWLLAQQQQTVHPFTGADPGGWGWSHLTGSVPDADDTAGALLALRVCSEGVRNPRGRAAAVPDTFTEDSLRPVTTAAQNGVRWLLGLQNRDGGWPTFCRGWQRLPFDRSAPDLTAHALRALHAWRDDLAPGLAKRIDRTTRRGFAYLARAQRPDGRWAPLWFGNEDAPDEENPVVGTARVLMAYRDLGRLDDPAACRGRDWLAGAQNDDASWGGDARVTGSIEETALACEALVAFGRTEAVDRALAWLCRQILSGGMDQPRPIGLYFARLWYWEAQYPPAFTASAIRRAIEAGTPESRRGG